MKQYRGVAKNRKRWSAKIKHGGPIALHLGTFDTAEQAALAYDEAAIRYHGSSAKLNFTDRKITVKDEQIYKLVSRTFTALLMRMQLCLCT